jgi:hypothetical protein
MKTKAIFELFYFFVFMFILLIPSAFSSYCDLNLNPQLFYYQNSTLINSFNLSKKNLTTYYFNTTNNQTNVTEELYLMLNCNQSKTFFIIKDSETIYVEPNKTIKISFLLSPVVFTNYKILSYGLFDIPETTINNLSDVYNYTINLTFPAIAQGEYYQTFEITNGLQTQYVTYKFINNITPYPIILKFNYPIKPEFYKKFNVSLIALNTKNASVIINNQTFNLNNISENYFEGEAYILNKTNEIKLICYNDYTNISKTYNISPTDITFNYSQSMLFPSLPVNQSTNLLLIDFNVSFPIPISVNTSTFDYQIGNMTNQSYPSFDYFILDEDMRIIRNEGYAKKLYVSIIPHQSVRSLLKINIKSPFFQPEGIEMTLEWVSSEFTQKNEVNFTYYNKYVSCKIVGNYLDEAKYECKFYLPYNVNPEQLEGTELKILKDGYEQKLSINENKIKELEMQRTGLLILILVFILSIAIYYLKNRFVVAI